MTAAYRIKDGLSNRTREFYELKKNYFVVDSRKTQNILEELLKKSKDKGLPDFFEKADAKDIALMMDGVIDADGKTDPAVALYAASANLFGNVRDKINEFPDKRIDFYYRKVLGQDKREFDGDHAFVTFDIENENVSCVLPKGTRFSAGVNSKGEDIEFESISDANLNDVKVAKILTLSNVADYPIVQTELPVYKVSQAVEQKMVPYPLFGLTRSNDVLEGTKFSRLGICISDRIFCMSSGERNVKVDFTYVPNSIKNTVFDGISGAPKEFLAVLSSAFRVSLTTSEGWLDVKNYRIVIGNGMNGYANNQMSLEFTLNDSDPPIVNYNPEIHGGEFRFKHPMLRLLMNPHRSQGLWYAYRQMKLQSVNIAVNVSKCRDIVASNEFGPVSMDLPVQPFGPVPALGHSFILGCKETCGKDLDSFTVHGKWCGLPKCKDFSEWYSQYENPPHTSDFMVALSGLYNGSWVPPEKKEVLCNLFKTVKNEGYERKDEEILPDFDISFKSVVCLNTSVNIPDEEYFMYTPSMKDGFFKMKLVAPDKAFLHGEVSEVICNSYLSKVKEDKDNKKKIKLPNQPYTPSIEDLYVDYTAQTKILPELNDGHKDSGIFFVHPFGFSEKEKFILESGILYLGILFKGKPKKANFYFLLNRDSAMRSSGNEKCKWSYLGPLGWTPVPDENRLADSTTNFTSSGIVTLNLPNDMVNDSCLMPKGYYWIRIEPCEENWRECSRLLTVFTQSLEVKRVSGFEDDSELEHCKPQTIKELTTSVEGFSNVYQFEESFGGKRCETDSEMRTRVAESLYNKNRCVCAEDYERMVLQNFPELLKVKCFPHTQVSEENGSINTCCPRSLLLIPISPLYNDGSFQWDPCVRGNLLYKIREFVQKNCPGISKVQVRNPFFDKLQVRCNIVLRSLENEGEAILDLNEKISRFLSPWYLYVNEVDKSKVGGIVKHFGWSIQKEKLIAFIESLDYVKQVDRGKFTLMKIKSVDDRKFDVNVDEEMDDSVVSGSFPCSVPVPMRKHFIEVKKKIENPVNNGYGALEIGQTFIIRKK